MKDPSGHNFHSTDSGSVDTQALHITSTRCTSTRGPAVNVPWLNNQGRIPIATLYAVFRRFMIHDSGIRRAVIVADRSTDRSGILCTAEISGGHHLAFELVKFFPAERSLRRTPRPVGDDTGQCPANRLAMAAKACTPAHVGV
jgi:hypothetical protein